MDTVVWSGTFVHVHEGLGLSLIWGSVTNWWQLLTGWGTLQTLVVYSFGIPLAAVLVGEVLSKVREWVGV